VDIYYVIVVLNVMKRREYLKYGSGVACLSVAGCTQGSSDEIRDSDGDGMIDSRDYAPNDADVQEKSDIQSSPSQVSTPEPTPVATPRQTSTATPWPTFVATAEPTATELPDSDYDGVADRYDDFPDDFQYSEIVREERATEVVDPGYYRFWSWESDEAEGFVATIDVQSGSHVDAILMDESDFDEFENSESYYYYTSGTDFETKYAELSARLDAGSFMFVVSNWEVDVEETSTVDVSIASKR
jgi:hypothetical protein